MVNDLQIYPVIVKKNPEKMIPVTGEPQDILQITERIYQKTSTHEVQWIYSHDFHIFAIIHEEDTLEEMVNKILGKLDEIVISTQSGIHFPSPDRDRQILREAFDVVMNASGGPSETPMKLSKTGHQPKNNSGRPLILQRAQPGKIPHYVENQIWVEPGNDAKSRDMQKSLEGEEINRVREGQTPIEPNDSSQHPLMLINDEYNEPSEYGEVSPVINLGVRPVRPVPLSAPIPKVIPAPQPASEPVPVPEMPKRPVSLSAPIPKVIPAPQPATEPVPAMEMPKRPVPQIGRAPRRERAPVRV
jgi:hypothetical protein